MLFADVVHLMDIAPAVGPERLREIMTDLVDRASAVLQRYGGTVDKFTGDGIMAVFHGTPVLTHRGWWVNSPYPVGELQPCPERAVILSAVLTSSTLRCAAGSGYALDGPRRARRTTLIGAGRSGCGAPVR